MKAKIVDYFPTLAGAEEGVFYFNRRNKTAKLYRNGGEETYYAVLPNLGEPGSRYKDSDNDGIADIREASTNDLQDIGWTPADGSTFNKAAYTNSSGVTISAVQVGIGTLNNLLRVLFNGSGSSISLSAEYDGAIKRHNNDWANFTQGQTITLNDGDYLLYNQYSDSDGDGVVDSLDAFPNDASEDTDADGDGVGANTDIDDNDPNRSSGTDTDGDGIDDEFDLIPDDGPLADSDNDGIINSQDDFPDDATNTKYDQQLVWNEYSAGMLLSNSPIYLSATTDSGETISYTVTSGPGSINGNALTLNSAGTITVEAFAPGNNTYNPRTISRSFNITDDVTDTDGDGTPDNSDSDNTDGPLGDSDGDGTPNNQDSDNTDGPLGDSDGDGIPNNQDNDNTDGPLGDSDGDGTPNNQDNDNTDGPLGDIDGDGIPNNQDSDNTDGPLGDSDGDGIPNNQELVNVATLLNPANNVFLAGTISYDWRSQGLNSNPRRAFNGDLTTSYENITMMDTTASDGGWAYADIVNAGAGPTDSGWIGLDLNSLTSAQKKITQYEISSLVVNEQMAQGTPLANGGSDPKDWTFEGSNDGTNWTVLDTQTNQSFSDASMNGELKQYNFTNTTEYRYYRLNVSANHGAVRFGVQELRFNYLP